MVSSGSIPIYVHAAVNDLNHFPGGVREFRKKQGHSFHLTRPSPLESNSVEHSDQITSLHQTLLTTKRSSSSPSKFIRVHTHMFNVHVCICVCMYVCMYALCMYVYFSKIP